MKISSETIRRDYKRYLQEGLRPTELVVFDYNGGGLASYAIANSKANFSDITLDFGQYLIFRGNFKTTDPIFENY